MRKPFFTPRANHPTQYKNQLISFKLNNAKIYTYTFCDNPCGDSIITTSHAVIKYFD